MPASRSRLLRRPLGAGTAGAAGGWAAGAVAAGDDAEARTASVSFAAAARARAASTVPAPDPSLWPPARPKTVLSLGTPVTCAGLRAGNRARLRAAIPVTTALAAAVLLTMA